MVFVLLPLLLLFCYVPIITIEPTYIHTFCALHASYTCTYTNTNQHIFHTHIRYIRPICWWLKRNRSNATPLHTAQTYMDIYALSLSLSFFHSFFLSFALTCMVTHMPANMHTYMHQNCCYHSNRMGFWYFAGVDGRWKYRMRVS